MLKKILVPSDFSTASNKALGFAVELAKITRSDVIVLHVLQEWWLTSGFTGEDGTFRSPLTGEEITEKQYTKELYGILKSRAERLLETQCEPYKDSDIKIKKVVSIGSPVDEIIELADEDRVDIIVIGNVGLSGLSKLKALGSVSRAVSERAHCPVTIVR